VPASLINAVSRSFHTEASLRETLVTMAARLVPDTFAILSCTAARGADRRAPT
jgi:hypothetical protein